MEAASTQESIIHPAVFPWVAKVSYTEKTKAPNPRMPATLVPGNTRISSVSKMKPIIIRQIINV